MDQPTSQNQCRFIPDTLRPGTFVCTKCGKSTVSTRMEQRCRSDTKSKLVPNVGRQGSSQARISSFGSPSLDCRHRGNETRRVPCKTCGGKIEIKVFHCDVHHECTLSRRAPGIATCDRCPDRASAKVAIAIAVLTAPREVPTLTQTIFSLRSAGFDQTVHVFAEPGSTVPELPNVVVHHNQQCLGAMGNWRSAAKYLCESDDASHILICEDDVAFEPTAADQLDAAIGTLPPENIGYLSLYTAQHSANARPDNSNGWFRIGKDRYGWGALAYCLRKTTAESLLGSDIVLREPGMGHPDKCVTQALHSLNLSTWYHYPSLASHTGFTSTLGHTHRQSNDAAGLQRPTNMTRVSLPGRMAVVTCLFNPLGLSTRELNYQRFIREIQASGIDVYTIEMVFGEDDPVDDIDGKRLRIRGSSVLWQKERLLNHVIHRLPANVDKVAWVDADVLFETKDWPQQAARLLEFVPVVQLFESVQMLGPNDEVQQRRTGVGWAISHMDPNHDRLSHFHPGLAWAARREVLETHGLYDALIVGGADSAMVCAMAGWLDHEFFDRLRGPLREHCLAWASRFHSSILGRIGYLPIVVRHVWHGDLADRRYVNRFSILSQHAFDPNTDVRIAENGVWKWASPKPELHRAIVEYFRSRNEDGAESRAVSRSTLPIGKLS